MEQVVREIRLEAFDVRVENENYWSVVLQATVAGDGGVAISERKVIFRINGKKLCEVETNEFGEVVTEPILITYAKGNATFSVHVAGYILKSEVEVEIPKTPEVIYGFKKRLVGINKDGDQVWDIEVFVKKGRKWVVERNFKIVRYRHERVVETQEKVTDSEGNFAGQVVLSKSEKIWLVGFDIHASVIYSEASSKIEFEVKDKRVSEMDKGRYCLASTFVVRYNGRPLVGQEVFLFNEAGKRLQSSFITNPRGEFRGGVWMAIGEKAWARVGERTIELKLPDVKLSIVEKKGRQISLTRQSWDVKVRATCSGLLAVDYEINFVLSGRRKISGRTTEKGILDQRIEVAKGERITIVANYSSTRLEIRYEKLILQLLCRCENSLMIEGVLFIESSHGDDCPIANVQLELEVRTMHGPLEDKIKSLVLMSHGKNHFKGRLKSVGTVGQGNRISFVRLSLSRRMQGNYLNEVFLKGKVWSSAFAGFFYFDVGDVWEQMETGTGAELKVVLEGRMSEPELQVEAVDIRKISGFGLTWDISLVVRCGGVVMPGEVVGFNEDSRKKGNKEAKIITDVDGRVRRQVSLIGYRDSVKIGLIGDHGILKNDCEHVTLKLGMLKVEVKKTRKSTGNVFEFLVFLDFYGDIGRIPVRNKNIVVELFREKRNWVQTLLGSKLYDTDDVLFSKHELMTDSNGRAGLVFGRNFSPIKIKLHVEGRYCYCCFYFDGEKIVTLEYDSDSK